MFILLYSYLLKRNKREKKIGCSTCGVAFRHIRDIIVLVIYLNIM